MTLYTTPEFHLELSQVKEYNAGQSVHHMKFTLPNSYTERTRGWVVNVTQKNGVSTRQRFCQSYREARGFMFINYGVSENA